MRLPSNKALVLVTLPILVLAAVIVLIAQSREDVNRQMRPRRATPTVITSSEVRAGQDLQSAINSARCGDVIALQAGATWDGSYILPNKSCTQSTPITIRSSAKASLPAGRVGIADASHMPRIRAIASEGAFRAAAGAGWWILDGLEITDNAGRGVVNALVDLGNSVQGVHDITVQRCYFHQKEKGTDYNRSAMRAVWFEGKNLTFKWNYVHLIGYYYPELAGGAANYQMDTTAFLSISGPGPITIEDNFISVWWNGFFLGGGDTSPQHTATLTNASTTSATFSNTSTLVPGVIVRFALSGTGTWNDATKVLTLTSGTLDATDNGRAIVLTSGSRSSANCRLGIPAGASVPVTGNNGSVGPNGTYSWTVYETAKVVGLAGSTVNFTPIGMNALRHPGATAAAWNVGDEGLISDVIVQRNTFAPDVAFAEDVFRQKGYSPKGLFEIKNVNRFDFNGNRVIGYPANLGLTATNQNGTAPWISTRHIKIRNNWIEPNPYVTPGPGSIIVSENSYADTITPTYDVEITNNFIKNVRSLGGILKGGDKWLIAHNTVINTQSASKGYNSLMQGDEVSTNFVFRDNIGAWVTYGVQCFNASPCWPLGVWQNNLLVDTNAAGVTTSSLGARGIVGPVPTSFSFLGPDYRLLATSPYKGKASDGSDPGVDMGALMTALAGVPKPSAGER